MKTKLFHKISLAVTVLSFFVFAFLYLTDLSDLLGPFLIIRFISLAFAVRGFSKFKGFSYSLMILTAVTVAMFYPELFWGGW